MPASSSSGVLTHLSSPPACRRTETWPRAAGSVPAALIGPLSVSGATTCNALHFQSVNAIFVQIPKNAGSALTTFLPKLLGVPRRIAFDDASWRTAFVFAFARDPFVRAASAHAYLDRNPGADALFSRFCANPLKYLKIAGTGQSIDAHQRHTATQSGCVFTSAGEPAAEARRGRLAARAVAHRGVGLTHEQQPRQSAKRARSRGFGRGNWRSV